jgi:hypothetical protein
LVAGVADRVDQLPVRERIAFWARAREHTRERTAARLARGP